LKIFSGALLFAAAAALALGQAVAPAPVNRAKLESLHEAGKAFQQALADPNATVEKVTELRQKLAHEAARFDGTETSPAEQRIVSLYAAAARGYEETRNRFLTEKSREHFLADVRQIATELSDAENLFQGAAPAVPVVAPPPPVPAAPPGPTATPGGTPH